MRIHCKSRVCGHLHQLHSQNAASKSMELRHPGLGNVFQKSYDNIFVLKFLADCGLYALLLNQELRIYSFLVFSPFVEVPNFDLIDRDKLFSEFIPDHRFYFREDTSQRVPLGTTIDHQAFIIKKCCILGLCGV